MSGMPSKHQLTTDPLLIGWNGSALTSLLLPLIIMVIARCVNVREDDENGNNNDDNNNDGSNRSWWKFWGGNNNNNNEDNGGGSQDANIPWWWFSGRERDPEDEGRGALIFVYIWSWLLFLSLVLYGNIVFQRGSDFEGLQGALIMFANLAFMCLVLVAGLGAIRVEGRELEETGWYGQFSVCLFLTCLFWLIDGLVFTMLLRKPNKDTRTNNERKPGVFGLFKADKETAHKDDTSVKNAFEYERGDV